MMEIIPYHNGGIKIPQEMWAIHPMAKIHIHGPSLKMSKIVLYFSW